MLMRESREQFLDIHAFVALDIALHRPIFILGEFAFTVLFCGLAGAASAYRGLIARPSLGMALLGCFLLGIALNYAPLALHAVTIARRASASVHPPWLPPHPASMRHADSGDRAGAPTPPSVARCPHDTTTACPNNRRNQRAKTIPFSPLHRPRMVVRYGLLRRWRGEGGAAWQQAPLQCARSASSFVCNPVRMASSPYSNSRSR
jgi:hypothetical protein